MSVWPPVGRLHGRLAGRLASENYDLIAVLVPQGEVSHLCFSCSSA